MSGRARAGAAVAAALLLCALSGLAAAAADPPYDWGAVPDEPTSTAEFAQSKAICRRLGPPRPPAADLPSPAQTKALRGCDSAGFYYGVGGTRDYRMARLCAFAEGREDGPTRLDGAAILMQLYANGRGVKRDLDLATAYACQTRGAAVESDGRVTRLQAMRGKPEAFDFCDDASSDFAGGVCASRDADMAAAPRNARLQALTRRLSPRARALYRRTKIAFDAYVAAVGAVQEDGGGTVAYLLAVGEQEAVRDAFVRDLDRLLNGGWPMAKPAEAKAAGARLNAAYRKAIAEVFEPADHAELVEDMHKAERAWIAFRDAYVRFAAAAAPNTSPDAVLAHLANQRTAEVNGLAEVG